LEVKTAMPPGWQALHCAISSDYEANFDLVMAKGPDVLACTDDIGWTPLNMAAEHGSLAMVKKLLRAGALPDAETFASVHGSADCMEALAFAGAQITQEDADLMYRADRLCLCGLPGQPEFCDLINSAIRGAAARLELLRSQAVAPLELAKAATALEVLRTSRQRAEARDRAEMGAVLPDE
jgi:ankyrin repeat protein